ncbi:cytochrome b561 [Roseiarcus fermentans]|uniref:Cytochrome b561 n=1 Tax=Roseiarcus fermentans TaxID=1473586 RepID=A0A366FLD8_9HYPH|nr:cytochrome b/b6 domain-containing protein [Roseiarcus fermentans]RBP15482.1 cytochrome b561 [Roseiarcus fermentans]
MTAVSSGYSFRQIALHWLVFVLVAYQWFTGDRMTDLFRAAHGGPPAAVNPGWATIHVVVGAAVLLLMVWRLGIRRSRGAPPQPEQHPALQWLASAVHVGLYLDLIGGALAGLVAWFWLPGVAGLHHLMMRPVLLVLVALHLVGALWHRFVVKDDIMTRMIRPAR